MLGQFECRYVARLGKGIEHRHCTFVVILVVVWRIAAKTHRTVDDYVFWLGAALNRSRVDVGLEAGARLPLRLGGPVELGKCIVSPTNHGQHVA